MSAAQDGSFKSFGGLVTSSATETAMGRMNSEMLLR